MSEALALFGATPAFPAGLPFARPAAPALNDVVARLAPSYSAGALTNGPLVRELEERAADRIGVRHVVAVSSCTTGLMLALQAAVTRPGPVLMPSFTFAATAHAAAWNGRNPRFAECRGDLQLDTDDAATRASGSAAVVGTHMFGAPCHPEQVEAIGAAHDLPVVFDAAHAFGARRGDRAVGGFGLAEVFSMSPTKPLVAGEGGLVATDDDIVAEHVRVGRDYGNPGTYDTTFVGLNARLSELHAAVAIESLARLDEHLARRAALVARYVGLLAAVPGVTPQQVAAEDLSTHKVFSVVVDETVFGVSRDMLAVALRAEGVDTRTYFSPPVHRHAAYAHLDAVDLPCTDLVASRVLSLPMWRDLDERSIDTVVELIARVGEHADRLAHWRRSA